MGFDPQNDRLSSQGLRRKEPEKIFWCIVARARAQKALGFKAVMLGLPASQRAEAHGLLVNLFLNLPVTASEISQISLSFAGL